MPADRFGTASGMETRRRRAWCLRCRNFVEGALKRAGKPNGGMAIMDLKRAWMVPVVYSASRPFVSLAGPNITELSLAPFPNHIRKVRASRKPVDQATGDLRFSLVTVA